jgi:hypothetical protein
MIRPALTVAFYLLAGAATWEAVSLHHLLSGGSSDPWDPNVAAQDPSHPGHRAAQFAVLTFIVTWPAWMLAGRIIADIESRRLR